MYAVVAMVSLLICRTFEKLSTFLICAGKTGTRVLCPGMLFFIGVSCIYGLRAIETLASPHISQILWYSPLTLWRIGFVPRRALASLFQQNPDNWSSTVRSENYCSDTDSQKNSQNMIAPSFDQHAASSSSLPSSSWTCRHRPIAVQLRGKVFKCHIYCSKHRVAWRLYLLVTDRKKRLTVISRNSI